MGTLFEEKLLIEKIPVPGFHKVVRAKDPSTGLDAIIAIHDVRLSKVALGGTRIRKYPSFDDALTDVLRLAEGMTYKSVAAQCPWAGGKSVINADPATEKTPALLRSFGQAIQTLKGEMICAEDAGTTPQDVSIIAEETPFTVGLPHERSSGNPSPFTAWGVFRGIQAVLFQIFGSDSVKGRTIAVQGLGSVGERLAEMLFWHGARLIVTDVHMDKGKNIAKRLGAQFVEPDEIYDQPCDIFCPCGLGGIINPATIERLRCRAIAGAANNQLLSEADGEELRRMGILYAPDFVINAGGLINVTEETTRDGYNPFAVRNKLDTIYNQLNLIFKIARENGISTLKAVMQLIDYRLKHGIGKRHEPIYMHHAEMNYDDNF